MDKHNSDESNLNQQNNTRLHSSLTSLKIMESSVLYPWVLTWNSTLLAISKTGDLYNH